MINATTIKAITQIESKLTKGLMNKRNLDVAKPDKQVKADFNLAKIKAQIESKLTKELMNKRNLDVAKPDKQVKADFNLAKINAQIESKLTAVNKKIKN